MNLYDRAKADNKRILNGGFVADMTITNPSGTPQTVKGFYIDSPLDVDVETGMPIHARRIAAHVHLSDITIGNPATVAGTWQISFVNNSGDTITGVIETPDVDRTLNMVSFQIKVKKVVA